MYTPQTCCLLLEDEVLEAVMLASNSADVAALSLVGDLYLAHQASLVDS